METIEVLQKKIHGWIKSIRKSKSMLFISSTDGGKEIQLTLIDKKYSLIGEIKVGSSFIATGELSKTPKGEDEFLVSSIQVIGKSDDEYPIQPKHHSDDFLRTIPELRGRTKTYQSIWKIRHHLTQSIHQFLTDKEFIQYYTPIITSADCEGAGETFEVSCEWMKEKLTVSGQLHGEVGMMSLGKIYTFSPCFRAEKSSTKKHLSEFWMVEPEMSFFDLYQTISFSEEFIKFIICKTIDKCKDELIYLGVDIDDLMKITTSKWIVLKYDDLIKKYDLKYGQDISTEIEKKIISDSFGIPTFITHYPQELKPFYMKKDKKIAYCFDLIFPEVGELIGGSEREEDYEKLKSQMIEGGIDLDKMEWYLSTRKYGSVPHSGFGLGFERLLMYLTKRSKIHDVIPFPYSY